MSDQIDERIEMLEQLVCTLMAEILELKQRVHELDKFRTRHMAAFPNDRDASFPNLNAQQAQHRQGLLQAQANVTSSLFGGLASNLFGK